MTLRLPAILMLMTMLGLIAGCGWQLRGATQTPDLESLTLRGGSAELRFALEDRLQDMGITVHQHSPYRLVIEDEHWQRRTGAVDSRGRQAEIELRYHLRWYLADRDSQEPISVTHRMMSMRTFAYSPDSATSSADEELLLRQDLYDDMIDRMLSQLAVITHSLNSHYAPEAGTTD